MSYTSTITSLFAFRESAFKEVPTKMDCGEVQLDPEKILHSICLSNLVDLNKSKKKKRPKIIEPIRNQIAREFQKLLFWIIVSLLIFVYGSKQWLWWACKSCSYDVHLETIKRSKEGGGGGREGLEEMGRR